MKIPEKIKILGHWFKIEFPYAFKERFDRYAQCDDTQKIIYISEVDMNGTKRADSSIIVSFIHEVLHAIDLNIVHHIFDGKEGENKIEGFSEGIYQVLVDNGYLKQQSETLKDEVQNVSK